MKLFLSWSGARSRQIANTYNKWIKYIFPTLEIYISTEDIEPGRKWRDSIENGLEETYFGMLFLTPENLESRWIYYEAGSLSKGKNDSHVIPMLYQLDAGKLQEPLSAFQSMSLEKDNMLRVVKTINKKMAEVTDELLLEEIFDNWWEKWEEEADKFPVDIEAIEESIKLKDAAQMDIQEQIEEVLTRLRQQDGKEGVAKIPRLHEMDNDKFKMQELEDFSNVIREADFLDSEQKRTVITKMYNKMIDL